MCCNDEKLGAFIFTIVEVSWVLWCAMLSIHPPKVILPVFLPASTPPQVQSAGAFSDNNWYACTEGIGG